MYDAIVLAGGAARRLDGAAKPQLLVGGVRLVDRVLAAVHDASTVVVVGPEQPLDPASGHPVRWCRESPPGGGPVAAVAAGVALTSAPTVVLLAGDLPFVAPAVPALLHALGAADVAQLVDPGGRANHLAAAWRRDALVRVLAALGDPAGAAMRGLLTGLTTVGVRDDDGWGADCDTWTDLRAARAVADLRAARAVSDLRAARAVAAASDGDR